MPFDPEILLLQRGLKSLVKKEKVAVADVPVWQAIAADHGLVVAWDPALCYDERAPDDFVPAGHATATPALTTLLLARDRETAERGLELTRQEMAQHQVAPELWQPAARELGALLGYPPCCVAAFAESFGTTSAHIAQSMQVFESLHRTAGPLDPLLNPFVPQLRLYSHFPCTLNCAATHAQAEVVLTAWREADPGWVATWEPALRQPLVAWSMGHAVRLNGAWTADGLAYSHADRAGLHADASPQPIAHAVFSAANLLRFEGGDILLLRQDASGQTPVPLQLLREGTPGQTWQLLDWSGAWWPYIRPARVAFLDLHTTTHDYFDNDLQLLGGDVRRLGVATELIAATLGQGDDDRADPTLEALVAHLQARGVTAVVAAKCLDGPLFDRLGALGIQRMVLEAGGLEQTGRVDAVLTDARGQQTVTDGHNLRLDHLAALMTALQRPCPGVSLAQTPGLANVPTALAAAEMPFTPLTNYAAVTGLPRFRPTQWYVQGNTGCPYAAAYADPDAATYLPADLAGVTLRGCNFCVMGGDYRVRQRGPILAARLADEISYVRMHAPSVSRIVLGDTFPFPYLKNLLEQLLTRGLGDFDLLIQGRPDWILRYGPQLLELFDRLRAQRIQLALYLVGFENFSQPELDRYDKGLTVAQNLAVLQLARDWERDWPGVFTGSKYPGHGFLLWNPWTTLDDLRANARHIDAVQFGDFRPAWLLTRLRLYPHLAMYHRARAEGLFLDHYDHPRLETSRVVGYAPEQPWRSKDPAVDRVLALVLAFADGVRPDQHAKLLAAAVEWVAAAPDGAGDDAQLAEALAAQVATWPAAPKPTRMLDAEVALAEAQQLKQSGRLADALATVEAAIGQFPQNLALQAEVAKFRQAAWYGEGEAHVKAGAWADAEAVFRRILAQFPQERQAQRLLVRALERLGRVAEARAVQREMR